MDKPGDPQERATQPDAPHRRLGVPTPAKATTLFRRGEQRAVRFLWVFLPETSIARSRQFHYLLASTFLSDGGRDALKYGALVAVTQRSGSSIDAVLIGTNNFAPSRAGGPNNFRGTTLNVLNKSDLIEPFERAWERLAPYRAMGYTVLSISLRTDQAAALQTLQAKLTDKTSLVLGPSGAGKSTLINKLVPGLDILTGELSQALRAGKHTTTSTTWYWIDDSHTSALIDSPGFQEFGLRHIDAMRLARYMPDLSAHADHCRFYNCSHLHEPGCAVMAAVQGQPQVDGEPISADRYRIYAELFSELSESRY